MLPCVQQAPPPGISGGGGGGGSCGGGGGGGCISGGGRGRNRYSGGAPRALTDNSGADYDYDDQSHEGGEEDEMVAKLGKSLDSASILGGLSTGIFLHHAP